MAYVDTFETCTIANGASTSSVIDMKDRTLCVISLPATFTGTSLTFTTSNTSGGTFQNHYKDGANYSITVAQAKNVVVPLTDFAGVRYLKIVSGSSEGGARTITLWMRQIA